MSRQFKFDSKFCELIGANTNIKYSKTNIFNILISHASTKYRNCYEFKGPIKDFLSNILHYGWSGYRKSNLMTILNSLIVTGDGDNSKYVIISSAKSAVKVNSLHVVM